VAIILHPDQSAGQKKPFRRVALQNVTKQLSPRAD